MDIHALLTITVGLSFFSVYVEGEYCFRRIHGPDSSEAGATICRGLIEKETFPSSNACCSRKEGVAYSTELTTTKRSKRGKKWRCTPCAKDLVDDPFIFPPDVGWSSWSEWSSCSMSCGAGVRYQQRICQNSNPSRCEGESKARAACIELSDCPVDGNWGPWTSWTDCSKSCSSGTEQRSRLCNNPPPRYNGVECKGDVMEVKACNSHGCPVDGGWSEWTAGVCNATCGSGKQKMRRRCNNPSTQNNGKPCYGNDEHTQTCKTGNRCPLDGGWSIWSTYSSCSATCGEGLRNKTRSCVAPRPRYGGKNCTGDSTEMQACYSHYPCPVDGGWTLWGEWGTCLARPCSNQTGLQMSVRTCSMPLPQYRGKMCEGVTTQTRPCYYNENCPVDGGWCEWQPYSKCRKADGNIDFRMSVRECNCPVPDNGGKTCVGGDYRVTSCVTGTNEGDNSPVKCQVGGGSQLEGSGSYGDDEDCY